MSTLKIRVPNFTNSEKAHLMRLIANKYAGILEDKKTDRASSTQKYKAWEAIEDEFNASCSSSTYRNAICLKKCYENRKKELRKTLAEERKQTFLTGGGPPPKIKKDDTDDILKSILNEKTLVGLPNRFDDDADEFAIEHRNIEDIPIEYVYETEEVRDTQILPPELFQSTSTSSETSTNIFGSEPGPSEPTPNKSEIKPFENDIKVRTCLELKSVNIEQYDWKKCTPHKLKFNFKLCGLCGLLPHSGSRPLCGKSESGKTMAGGGDYNKTPTVSRRRPTTVIKPMTSSDIAKKYDLLLEKRLQLLDGQLKHMELENALSIKKLELEIKILEIELARKQ